MLKRWLGYCVLLFLVTVLHIMLEDYLSLFLFLFFLLLPVFSLIARLLAGINLQGVSVRFGAPDANKEVPIKLYAELDNKPRFAFSPVMIRLDIQNETTGSAHTLRLYMTASRSKQTVEYELSSDHCGRLACTVVEVRLYDYLGLFFFRRKKQMWHGSHMLVRPNVWQFDMDVEDTTIEDMESNEFSKIRPGDDPSEIFDIRAYREGDRMSRIHWKLSSKVGQLMVKEGGFPISSGILILFDLHASGADADGIIEALSSISSSLAGKGLSHKVRWFDSMHKHIIKEQIAKPEEFRTFLREVLNCARPEREPVALLDYIQDHERDAHVIYISSDITADSVNLLHNRLPESRLSIFDIRESNDGSEGLTAANERVVLFPLRPGEIAQGLEGAIL